MQDHITKQAHTFAFYVGVGTILTTLLVLIEFAGNIHAVYGPRLMSLGAFVFGAITAHNIVSACAHKTFLRALLWCIAGVYIFAVVAHYPHALLTFALAMMGAKWFSIHSLTQELTPN